MSIAGAPRRVVGALAGALMITAGCTPGAPDETSPGRADRASADASGSCYARGWERCDIEPYPFTTPLPPVEPTALDGTYIRTIPQRLASLEGKCRRCPPYRMLAGREVLTFDSGRFFMLHPQDGYRNSGHADVSNGRVTLFNDPSCTSMEGVYRWSVESDVLTFDPVRDPCPYTGLRRRYLTALPWTRSRGGIDARCVPPDVEAAISGHWAMREVCEQSSSP
ncbi:MAG: hypothetical protein ABR529_03330 [Actinomycetota bacterium]